MQPQTQLQRQKIQLQKIQLQQLQAHFPQWHINAWIGRGGSADVYDARDLNTGLTFALKVQHRPDKPSETVRFRREYQVLNGFRHPHLPRVYGFGELPDGRTFLTMELICGQSVRRYIRQQAKVHALRRASAVLEVGAQVAQTLADLHAKRVIHGDVKPSNIQVSDGGWVWLLDLGGARDLDAQRPWVARKHFFGTYLYAAPEQLRGDEAVDGRADLYSLGVILHDLLLGTRLFSADTREQALEERERVQPKPLIGRVEGVSQELSDLVMGLLVRDPSQRLDSAAEVAQRLGARRTEWGPQGLFARRPHPEAALTQQPRGVAQPWPAGLALARAQFSQGDVEACAATALALLNADTAERGAYSADCAGVLVEAWRVMGRLSQARELLWAALGGHKQDAAHIQAPLWIGLAEVDLDSDRLALVERWLSSVDEEALAGDVSLRERVTILRARLALAFGVELKAAMGALLDAVLAAKARGEVVEAARLLGWCASVRAALGWTSARAMADEAVEVLRRCGHKPWLAQACVCRVRVLNALGAREALPQEVASWFTDHEVPAARMDYYLAVAERSPEDLAPLRFAYKQLQQMWPWLSKDDRWAWKLIPWVARCEASF